MKSMKGHIHCLVINALRSNKDVLIKKEPA